MQRLLTALGYPCGKADGVCGEKTAAALLAFQKEHGLIPDGICGEKTWAALTAPAERAAESGAGAEEREELSAFPAGAGAGNEKEEEGNTRGTPRLILCLARLLRAFFMKGDDESRE